MSNEFTAEAVKVASEVYIHARKAGVSHQGAIELVVKRLITRVDSALDNQLEEILTKIPKD